MGSAADFIRNLSIQKPEKALVNLFKLSAMARRRPVDPLLPFFEPDTDPVVYEMALRYGRADIVIFHADSTVTVIEAKDGCCGYTSVIQGIGQVCFYATQIALKGQARKVRRALMWSSAGDKDVDTMITLACEHGGVIPIANPTLSVLLAAVDTGVQAVAERQRNGN